MSLNNRNTINSHPLLTTEITNTPDIAIMGGTFDPIHNGHIETAKAVAHWLNVTHITLLPAHIPPHKQTPCVSSDIRAELVQKVCQHDPLFSCDTRELTRQAPSFTVDTLSEYRQEHPHSRLFFLIGMDSLLNFTAWHKWKDIMTLCHLVVSTRPGYELSNLPAHIHDQLAPYIQKELNQVKGIAGAIIFAPPCHYNISSTEIRKRIENGEPIVHWLPSEVAKYIESKKIYLRSNKSI